LRIALYRVVEARALYGIQRAEQFPTVTGQLVSSRARIPADLSPTGQRVIASEYTRLSFQCMGNRSEWDACDSLKDAATLQSYLATEEARRAVELRSHRTGCDSYLIGRELDELIGLAERTMKTRDEFRQHSRRRYEVGSAGRGMPCRPDALNQARTDLVILLRSPI